jgi:hypothetical protein
MFITIFGSRTLSSRPFQTCLDIGLEIPMQIGAEST